MTARKRKVNESFKDYRADLKFDAIALRARKFGRFLWVSKRIGDKRGDGRTYRKEQA